MADHTGLTRTYNRALFVSRQTDRQTLTDLAAGVMGSRILWVWVCAVGPVGMWWRPVRVVWWRMLGWTVTLASPLGVVTCRCCRLLRGRSTGQCGNTHTCNHG